MFLRTVVAIGASLLAGCATIFSGTSQNVTFTSEPDGATVMIDGDEIGETPLTYEVERKTFSQSIVTLRKAGYRSEQFRLRKTLETTALINCTSFLSWGTDALTGAMMEYSPDKYFVELAPGRRANHDASHRWALQFVLVNHRRLALAIARREGEQLRTLAELFGVTRSDYALFTALLGEHASELVAHEHPHALFRAISKLLEPHGFEPKEPSHPHFDNSFELLPRFRPATIASTADL